MDEMIVFDSVDRRFGDNYALKKVSFEVKKGEIFGFIGPNGAGKTTTINLISCLLNPSSGMILINGRDTVKESLEIRRKIGLIPEQPYLYEKLTGREVLWFVGRIFGLSKDEIEEHSKKLCKDFDLETKIDELVESYSHGMKQKLVISAALIHNPELLVVDEPMVGLDPKSAKLVREIFREKTRNDGCTVFISTHTLELAESICDRIAVINKGEIVTIGSMDELREATGQVGEKLEEIFLKLVHEEI
ncbi:MAG: ABC transporter ATP-binding protein [Candidatus Schekmanbacteria bacterium]|nr:MAG: ABC transporter ATP-binding protein [Candidatus Schekmanbacteria bacterium]